MIVPLQESNMSVELQGTATPRRSGIDHNAASPPVTIPAGHVGEFVIPGTGRMVWWTGRVAIGLLHRPERCVDSSTPAALWIQDLMLGSSAH